jgi:chromosome partitioning protein
VEEGQRRRGWRALTLRGNRGSSEPPPEEQPEAPAAEPDGPPHVSDTDPSGEIPPAPEPAPEPEPEPEPAAEPEPVADTLVEAVAEEPAAAPEPPPPPPPPPAAAEPAKTGGAWATDAVAPLQLPAILAIANQKGGVGKTTTAVNLGAALAEGGLRVLVVDLDPQGNASTGLGINSREIDRSIYDVMMSDAAIEDTVEPTSLKNLFVAPSTIDLAGAEIELVSAFSRELKLRRALETVRDDYDLVLIDCPPSLGLLTVNGLAAADGVLVPIQCEYYALEGLGQLLRNVGLVRANLNPALDVRGIILTMYDKRTKLADQVVQEVRTHFGHRVFETIVPRTVRLSEAPSFGQPIIVFDATSKGAKAYRALAEEVSRGATRRAG